MKLGTSVYQVILADEALRPLNFLGTAFPITPDGGLLTCRHVAAVDNTAESQLALVDGNAQQIVPISEVRYPENTKIDMAFLPNAIRRRRGFFFPMLEPDRVIMGEDTYSVGYYKTSNAVSAGYFKGHIVNFGGSTLNSGPASMSLSYPVIEGLSGSPVITYHNGPKALGICYGNHQSRILAHETLDYQEEEFHYKESVNRIVELGQAHHARVMIEFLEEVDANGFIVTAERIPGLEE